MAARSFFCWLMSQQRFLGPGPHLAARRVAIESPRGTKREPTGRQMPPRIHSPSFKDKFIWMSRRMVKKMEFAILFLNTKETHPGEAFARERPQQLLSEGIERNIYRPELIAKCFASESRRMKIPTIRLEIFRMNWRLLPVKKSQNLNI